MTVPALAADAVLGELRGFDACPSHKTKSLTSAVRCPEASGQSIQ